MGNVLTSISIILLCISSILQNIINRNLIKEIDRIESEIEDIKANSNKEG